MVAELSTLSCLSMQGRFYFGELMEDDTGCDEDVSAVKISVHSFNYTCMKMKGKKFIICAKISLICQLLFSCMQVLQKWLLLRLGCL